MASPRQSILTSRHKALGSPMGDWNGMDVPWGYDQDINFECLAVRKDAGLFDVSAIKKIHITGPDAVAVADHVCTADVARMIPGEARLGIVLDDDAHIVDDCMMM